MFPLTSFRYIGLFSVIFDLSVGYCNIVIVLLVYL